MVPTMASSLFQAQWRNHNMVYVCYDNEAYMNTGIQRSSATPMYADTISPNGRESDGKSNQILTEVLVAHDIPHVPDHLYPGFQGSSYKAEKAIYTKGAAF